jgi:hypothetical protein
LPQPACDAPQCPALGWGEVVGDEQAAILKQFVDAFVFPQDLFGTVALGPGDPAARQGREFDFHLFADFGQRVQDRECQFFDDMETADLVRHTVEDQRQRAGVKVRTIGGDASHLQVAFVHLRCKGPEEAADVHAPWRMIEHAMGQTAKGSVVDDAQHTERAIVQFIDGDVPRETL